MIEKIKKFIFGHEKMEEVLFWGVLILVGSAALVSSIFTATENIDIKATIFCALCCLLYTVIGIIAKITHRYSECYFAQALATNVVSLAPLFFFCGGFNSGMILYCMVGIFVASLHQKPRQRNFLVFLSIFIFEVVFFIAHFYPEFATPVDSKSAFIDITVSFFLMSITIFVVISYLLGIYQDEREKREKLIEQLDFLAVHDQLTILYNRRYFIKFLEDVIWENRKNFFILMYDIDDFKKVNNNYGHLFGDQVLREIAQQAIAQTCPTLGEFTVRYGGEEFIQVIRADNIETAQKRAEQLRESISQITFEKYPEVHITISGGLVDCADDKFTHQNKMLSFVDGLLFLAKKYGKNRIISKP